MNAVRRGLGNAVVQAFLVVVGLVWLTPLAGLLLYLSQSAPWLQRAAGMEALPAASLLPLAACALGMAAIAEAARRIAKAVKV